MLAFTRDGVFRLKRLLALMVLALSGCVTYTEHEAARYQAENAAREDAAKAENARRGGKYLATIALFPSGSGGTNCVLTSVAPSMTPEMHLDLRPSEAFMQTACAHALEEVSDYIGKFYNRTRRHSHLGGISPEEFEVAHKASRRSVH